MYDLRSFLKAIENDKKDLVKISRSVDRKFEATAVLEKMQYEDMYPAVLFENIKGSDIPVLSNLFASRDRIARAFGVTTQELNKSTRARSQAY